jgi:hypothetical protein
MCGEDEDDSSAAEELYARFVAHAKALLGQHAPRGGSDPYVYMDKLFADALSRCARDAGEADSAERAARLAAQPLVLARLAGFLASHLPSERDPLRQVVEALMLGYGETERLDHADAHAHGHDHDHDHEHGHEH